MYLNIRATGVYKSKVKASVGKTGNIKPILYLLFMHFFCTSNGTVMNPLNTGFLGKLLYFTYSACLI